jgi:hypothetical protein
MYHTMKRCTLCGETKPLSQFYFYEGRHLSRCKRCESEKSKARYHSRKQGEGIAKGLGQIKIKE